jgi:uncharacterized protein YndB with AHSA1/START domain
MKIVKWLLGLVLALAVLLVAGGTLLSPRFTVVRSVQIAAPPEKVFVLVVEPRRWKDWTVWNRRDPQMQIEYSGPASGPGSAWAWKSKTEGEGRMSFTAAEPPSRVAYELYFPDFGTTSHGEFRIDPTPGGSRVTWLMNGDMGKNPLLRWFALNADGMVGTDFEAGLAKLKRTAEQ